MRLFKSIIYSINKYGGADKLKFSYTIYEGEKETEEKISYFTIFNNIFNNAFILLILNSNNV